MTIRPLQEHELPAVLRLWNDAAAHDVLTLELLAEKVRQDPDEGATCLLACNSDGDRLLGFGMGVIRVVDGVSRGIVKLLAVEPAARRQGTGAALLRRVEAALTQRGASVLRVAESAPNYLVPGIDARYENGLSFFAAQGYTKTGEAYNLQADLQAGAIPTLQALGDTIELRRAGPDDLAPLAAFLAQRWPTWHAEVMSAAGNEPASLHVAVQRDAIIGFAAHDANNRGTAWFGPMGVEGNARRSGVGCALLRRCLADMQRQGHLHAIIPWVDAVPFYEKCAGATLFRTFVRFEKVVPA
ncbi:MAG: GNAT family N-acetyltransferase [Woeseiaceae bacterium]